MAKLTSNGNPQALNLKVHPKSINIYNLQRERKGLLTKNPRDFLHVLYTVGTVILALHFLDQLVHRLHLLVDGLLQTLLAIKQLNVRLAIVASHVVPERSELAIVVVEVVVVDRVAGGSVNYGRVGSVFTIVYKPGLSRRRIADKC